jgi:L-serine dehydratase
MFLSVFDIFKVGVGPSSSHTVGPMVAARRFLGEDVSPVAARARRVKVSLHGSLAFTGKGHGTDRAIALGLAGEAPDRVDPDRVPQILAEMKERKNLGRSERDRLPGARHGRRRACRAHLLLRRRRLRSFRGGAATGE